MKKLCVLLCLLLVCLVPALTSAAVPQTINYQGYLTDSTGVAVNGSVGITFRLYSSATGGVPLWTETQAVSVVNGLYSVQLGSVTLFAIAFDQQYWLGVSVGADPEMSPRQPLTSSPYAIRAASSDSVSDANVVILDNAQTLTGIKTFNPSTGNVPFVVGTGKTGNVPLLNADYVDGLHASSFIRGDVATTVGAVKTFNPGTGTVPFVVDPSKTSVVTNLNADMIDGQHAAAFAGATHSHGASDITAVNDSALSANIPLRNAANTFTTGTQTIQTGAPANVGLAVQGSVSQTANLQEWRNSGGTVVASVGPSGILAADGSAITNINSASHNHDASYVSMSGNQTISGTKTFSSPIVGSITGNSATATTASSVTNGVYTTGAYADPSWLTSLSGAKISGTLLGTTLSGTYSNALHFTSALNSYEGDGSGLKNLDAANIWAGVLPVNHGGTGLDSGPQNGGYFLRSVSQGTWGMAMLAAGDIPDITATYMDLWTPQTVRSAKIFAEDIAVSTPLPAGGPGSSQNSNKLKLTGKYWSGASADDSWEIRNMVSYDSGSTQYGSTLSFYHPNNIGGPLWISMPYNVQTGPLQVIGDTYINGNLQISGTSNISIAAHNHDASYVSLTTSQTVAGTKTFSSPIVGSITGNAGTVTNGVYTTGTYTDPSWLTSLAGNKISGNISGSASNVTGTVGVANGGTGATTASTALANLGAASINGNAGAIALGTTDNNQLTLKVNNVQALRIMPHATSPNIIAGNSGNSVTSGAYGAVIGGGGEGPSEFNRVTDIYGTVAGGASNTAGDGLGTTTDSGYATVGGGRFNSAYGQSSTVSGGWMNTAYGTNAAIAGGSYNNALDSAAVGGGSSNSANSQFSVIGGGYSNLASGNYSVIPGGSNNVVSGAYSFAAGRFAYAATDGSFVWADATTVAPFGSGAPNQFLVKAAGGVGINKENPATALDVNGTITATAFSGSGSGLSGIWRLSGNSGTVPGTDFIGTTDLNALVLKVNNLQAFRIDPDPNSPNIYGGYSGNSVTSSAFGSFIGGGGAQAHVNIVTDNYGTVAGGYGNQAGDAGGTSSNSSYATVAGGYHNTASGNQSTVGGGANNLAGIDAVVAGGVGNAASGLQSAVGGGNGNTASGEGAAIGGGRTNTANSYYATVPGGEHNTAAGRHSFAAGSYANAAHDGAFVWADDSNTSNFSSTASNQFLVKATGGVGINKNNPATALDVNGSVTATSFSGSGAGLSSVPVSALSGTLSVAGGGTGLSNFSVGDLLYASGASVLSKLPDVATGNALISGGIGVAPSWGKVGLGSHVSGILPIANGGTGSSTQNFVDLSSEQSIGGAKTFTGTVTANAFVGDGSGLMNVNASQLNAVDLTNPQTIAGVKTFSDKVTASGGIYSAESIGIGTSSPSTLLDAKSDSGSAYMAVDRFTDQLGGIYYRENGVNQWLFPFIRGWQSNNLIVRDEVGARDTMTFESLTGRVGIGTSSPAATLDVAGTVRASGQLISAVATGTEPLQITSTTMVTNLNAHLLNGFAAGSFSRRPGRVAVVDALNGDFSSPEDALYYIAEWCGVPESSNPCLLKIMPGVYTISAPLQFPGYVDMEGSGTNMTILTSSSQVELVRSTGNMEIRDLSIKNTYTPAGAWAYGLVCGAGGSGILKLSNVAIALTVGGTTLAAAIDCPRYSVMLNNVSIDVNGGNTTSAIYGIRIDPTTNVMFNSAITNSSVRVSGGSGPMYGIYHATLSGSTGSNLKLVVSHSTIDSNAVGGNIISGTQLAGTTVVTRIINTQLASQNAAGVSSGTLTCAGVYDENYSFSASLCP